MVYQPAYINFIQNLGICIEFRVCVRNSALEMYSNESLHSLAWNESHPRILVSLYINMNESNPPHHFLHSASWIILREVTSPEVNSESSESVLTTREPDLQPGWIEATLDPSISSAWGGGLGQLTTVTLGEYSSWPWSCLLLWDSITDCLWSIKKRIWINCRKI